MAVFVLGAHDALPGVQGAIDTDLLDHHAQILLVDLHEHAVVGILHHGLYARVHAAPSHIAPTVEEHGEVGILVVELDHVGVEAREEEDIVDEL